MLYEVITELVELEEERQRNVLLHDVCAGLEKLDACAAADLFWRGLADAAEGRTHVGVVRERVDAFQRQLEEIDAGRQRLIEEIRSEQQNGDYIADDLYELERAEEERKLEWT